VPALRGESPSRRAVRVAAAAIVTLFVACAAPAADPVVRVDVSRPGAAISPYVYGQFIEHLGRCIYGGIWAEMLKDRKFLLEPGKVWEIVKDEGAVCETFHDSAGAYAGDHSLALWHRGGDGRCGIRQGELGLIAGEEYVGYAVLARVGPASPVEVRLAWGGGAEEGASVALADVGERWAKLPFRFRAGATTDAARLGLELTGPGYLWVAGLSLMPADNLRGLRPDALALYRRLNPPITRWPGGNFVSGYDWKDGIGDRDRRPPRWERAWNDVESNDFGIHEFLDFCREVGTEPYIAVNSGLGSVDEAADEVEYVNGAASTRWGAERARNGHPEPWGVAWWGVGNEMYGDWQLGNVPAERYGLRHNAFTRAMQERDPGIRVVGVGNPGRWNDVVLPYMAGNMDLLSGHHYTERGYELPLSAEASAAYARDYGAYSGSVAAGVRRIVEDFRQRQVAGSPEGIARLRLAIDEWGIVRDWESKPDAPGIGAYEHYYTLGDAVAVARAVHELARSADVVEMANWAQAVNVIGAIKTSRTHAALDPAGHVLALYRARLGGALLPAEFAESGTVDAVASLDRESGVVSVALVNHSPDTTAAVAVRVAGFAPSRIDGWRIHGPSLDATNVPGELEQVTTTPLPGPVALDGLTLPAHSLTVIQLRE
jgi:alpha-N-arabinofuranosidase